jgi:hypothetical protein
MSSYFTKEICIINISPEQLDELIKWGVANIPQAVLAMPCAFSEGKWVPNDNAVTIECYSQEDYALLRLRWLGTFREISSQIWEAA